MTERAVARHAPPIAADADGVLRVGSTRVTLDSIVTAFTAGSTAEQIVHKFPSVDLADVYAAISYYLRETQQVHEYLRERANERERVKQQNESCFDPEGIRDRLVARRAK